MTDRRTNTGHLIAVLCLLISFIQGVAAYGQVTIPSFTTTPTNVTVQKGAEAVMRCGVENLGTKTVSWRKLPYNVPITVGNEQFLELQRFKLVQRVQFGEWNLHIKNAQTFDSGTYECQVSLKGSSIRRNITLKVYETKGKPVEPSIEISGTQFVEKGTSILLTCNVTSEDTPQSIDWFVEGRKIQTDYARQVYIHQQVALAENMLSSTLEIERAQMADMGKYVCRASKALVTRINVDVLNETNNEKRDTPESIQTSANTMDGRNSSTPNTNGIYLCLLLTCIWIMQNLT
ncbi:hemicentin-1-like isoform X2 [Mya arenaria]|uniref:hemicentin-1-like isoform X2 n=1 Tax=Mya arenaria TaxID=6604 RepID=UPI0022DFF17F|nr:hemicentin-1-like isoform X2 [Mya arenaria]